MRSQRQVIAKAYLGLLRTADFVVLAERLGERSQPAGRRGRHGVTRDETRLMLQKGWTPWLDWCDVDFSGSGSKRSARSQNVQPPIPGRLFVRAAEFA